MPSLTCNQCQVEIIPGTNFCRSCGAPVERLDPSEMQTAILDGRRADTQRFEARTTSEADGADPFQAAVPVVSAPPATASFSSWRVVAVVLVLVVLLAAGGGMALMQRLSSANAKIEISERYNYPGARTVVNVGDTGGAVRQMETPDRIEQVSDWYNSSFKPAKTIQVTRDATIIRDDTVTITLVSSDAGTSIVIKQSPR